MEASCAQNADSTLKDASEIQWSFSQDSSPILDNTPPDPPPLEPSHGKALQFSHIRHAITNAVNPKKATHHHHLTNSDWLEILDHWHTKWAKNKKYLQVQCAAHFQCKFPNIKQLQISRIIKEEAVIWGSIQDNPANIAYKHI